VKSTLSRSQNKVKSLKRSKKPKYRKQKNQAEQKQHNQDNKVDKSSQKNDEIIDDPIQITIEQDETITEIEEDILDLSDLDLDEN
jgi:hypothetical protein